MIEKMRHGQAVPKRKHTECLDLMWNVLSDPSLHAAAARGFKKVGQTVELHGNEDQEICREAGVFWNEPTIDLSLIHI